MFSQHPSSIKYFYKILFWGSLRFNLSTGRDAERGRTAYIRICPDPTKAEPILGGALVVLSVNMIGASEDRTFNPQRSCCTHKILPVAWV